MLNPKSNEKVLDPACGTGGFLVNAMNEVINELKETMTNEFKKPEYKWSNEEYQIVKNKIIEIASNNFIFYYLVLIQIW